MSRNSKPNARPQRTRVERDSLGDVRVPTDRLWGAQTERSRRNFPIGRDLMPIEVIHALAAIKLAASRVNARFGDLDRRRARAIARAAAEIRAGRWDDHFPLVVWQTGSGTQSNMNVNEVIANRANQILGGELGDHALVHPNDHVNKSQSSNDSFPTAMHIVAATSMRDRLRPALESCRSALATGAKRWGDLATVGRTHLQDATPVTLGQQLGCFAMQVEQGVAALPPIVARLCRIPQGGTATGTGLNTRVGFDREISRELAEITGLPLKPARNKFESIAAHDAIVAASGALNALAVALMKIANDVRLLASGPRCGLGEIRLPVNEPGSSIMPGKVNPTQCEALTMVCAQVMGNHSAITVGGSHGHLQLNAFKPMMIDNLLRSIQLLADATKSFTNRCLAGIEPNRSRIEDLVERSLMLVTLLVPEIGYDDAAAIAKLANADGSSLRDAALKLGKVSARDFDRWVDPGAVSPRRPRGDGSRGSEPSRRRTQNGNKRRAARSS